MHPAEDRKVTDLCLSCGLCCDGSLFWAVPVATDDDAPVTRDAKGMLRQPCACFNGKCTIYANRPNKCRDFDCGVVQAGTQEIPWARTQIKEMRRLIAALDAVLPDTDRSIYRRAAEFLEQHRDNLYDPEFKTQYDAALRALAEYEATLRNFHVREDRP